MASSIQTSSLRPVYPLSVSMAMIVVAVALSLVDLTFLNEVIGKVLDLGATASMFVAFALGFVGIAIMAHQGIKAAHGDVSRGSAIGHYALWVGLGMAFVLIRLFSASILQLNGSTDGENLLSILGSSVRQVDLVLAPLMFFLYIATGLMVKDGFKHLLINPEFDRKLAAWREARAARKNADSERRSKAEKRMLEAQAQAEKSAADRQKVVEEGRIQIALNGSYSNALGQFRSKEKEIKSKYQRIVENIDYIKSIDKQEANFEQRVKPGLMRIVTESVHSAQNSIALALRTKTGEEITKLRAVIETYNKTRKA